MRHWPRTGAEAPPHLAVRKNVRLTVHNFQQSEGEGAGGE